MRKVVFDGRCINHKFDGAQRYAMEILIELDKIVDKDGYELLISPEYKDLIELNNIQKVEINCNSGWTWKIKVWNYLIKNHALYVHFSNGTGGLSIWHSSIITIHDIYAFYNVYNRSKKYYIKKKIKAILNVLFSKKIVTVSEYSKKTMLEKLPLKAGKIEVIGNGWQHIKKIQSDDNIMARFNLEDKQYYFFIGRLVKNKNIQWVFNVADGNPNALFVISGALSNETFDFYKGKKGNIIYTGFVSDSEMKSLYMHCKAFLFPSIMEGFGIPPMEALYNGVPIIIANTSSLPEVYGKSAHYIDPYKYDYCLDEILQEPVEAPELVLNRYSWEKSAREWKNLIERYAG
jgi:glycosyltransferase involved in cell wall biosynthesis